MPRRPPQRIPRQRVVWVTDHDVVPAQPAIDFVAGDVRVLAGGVLMKVLKVDAVGDRVRITGKVFGRREVMTHRPGALLAFVTG